MQTAQTILDARTLPVRRSCRSVCRTDHAPELRKAYQQNDRAVMEAYGLPVKTTMEYSCIAHFTMLYQELTVK